MGLLSARAFVRRGFYPLGFLSVGAFIRWGFFQLGLFSAGLLSVGLLSAGLLSYTLAKEPLHKENKEVYNKWKATHEPDCSAIYTGSAPGMESEGATRIFGRSVEKHGVRYLQYYGNGDLPRPES